MGTHASSAGPGRARAPFGRRGQVLIILVASLFLAGGSSLTVGVLLSGRSTKQMHKSIGRHVHDEARRKQAEAVVETWQSHLERDLKESEKLHESMLKLLVSHSTTRAQLDLDLARFDAEVNAGVERALTQRAALRAILTDGEWRAVFAP